MTKRRLAAALTLCLALCTAYAGDRTKETRVFDIGAIVREYREPAVACLGPLPNGFEEHWSGDDRSSWFLDADDLAVLIERAGLFGNGHVIGVEGERLHVRADVEDLPGVEALVTEIGRAATRRVEVEIRLLHAPSGFGAPDAGLLEPAAADRLADRVREAGGTVTDANTVSRPARRTSAGHVSVRSCVRDMSVEIAGGTQVGDPRVEWIREGWQVDVRPHVLAGGGVFLEALLQIVAIDHPVRRVDLEAHELGAVELPSLTRRILFTVGRVDPGRVMAITMGSGDGVRILLLRPKDTGRPVSRFLPTSALTRPAVGYRMEWAEDGDDDGAATRVDADADLPPLWPPRMRMLEIDRGEVPRYWPETGWSPSGYGVLVSPSERAETRKAVVGSESRLLRTLPVRLRVLFAKKEIASTSMLVVPGRHHCVSDGVLSSYVGDWTVEVASEGARIGDPEIEWAWGGTALTLRLDAGPDPDVFAARIIGEVATLDPTFETKRPGNTVTGVIEAPKGRTVAVDADTVLTTGRKHRIRPGGDVTIEITVGK